MRPLGNAKPARSTQCRRLGFIGRTSPTRGASSGPDAAGVDAGRAGARSAIGLGLLAAVFTLTLFATTAFADTEFGEEGTDAARVSSPEGVAVDPISGDVYVANGFSHRVNKYDANGNSLFAFGLGAATGAEIQEKCTTTCLASPFHHQTVEKPLLANARAVAVDPTNGDLYVLDDNYKRIEKFDSEGNFLFALGGDVNAYGPNNSSNSEVQNVTVTAEGGTFNLGLEWPYSQAYEEGEVNDQTAAIPFDATSAEVESALNAMSTIGGIGASVSVTGGPGNPTGSHPYVITFKDNLAGDDVPELATFGAESGFGNPATLTGSNVAISAETLTNGGAAEICSASAGDVCKAAGDIGSGLPGTFAAWPERATDLAVGNTGTLYVGDENRIQRFSPAGAYLGEVSIPAGGPTKAVAVDGNGDIFVISQSVSGVQEFDSAGALIHTFHPSGTPAVLAVDSSNNIYIGNEVNGGEPTATYLISAYEPTGTLLAQLHSPLIKENGEHRFNVNGIAIGNVAKQIYVTNSSFGFGGPPVEHVVMIPLPAKGPAEISEEQATNIEPTTATLHATINPEGYDTSYHFEYLDQQTFTSQGGYSGAGTHKTPSIDVGTVIQTNSVQAPISSLLPGTVYHFRIVAESECEPTTNPGHICVISGQDETVESLEPVSVRNFTTDIVGPELVKFKAELNPNGSATHYIIHFGSTTSYSDGNGSGDLGVSNEFESVEATFTGLLPNHSYHYQLIVENEYGKTVTADQIFTTELSADEERAAEQCPNTNLREENNSMSLPDCRAYEQVTPLEKAGGEAEGFGFAPSGERAVFYSRGAFAGAETNFLSIQYIASRSKDGWSSQAAVKRIAPTGTEPVQFWVLSPELDQWLYGEAKGLGLFSSGEAQSSAYYSMGRIGGPPIAQATPTFSLVEGAPRGIFEFINVEGNSDDLSRLFIPTRSRLLNSDPRSEDAEGTTRIYEVSGVGGANPAVTLAAEVPLGLKGGRCVIDGDNQTFGRHGRMVSTDGSTLLYTGPVEGSPGSQCGEGTPNPLTIFARINGGAPIQLTTPPSGQCTSPHPCATAPPATPRFQGASADGSKVWFTTTQPLINADSDTTNDLYLAKLANGKVSELVLASEGEVTPSHPVPGSGANLGEEGIEAESDPNNSGVVRVSNDGSHITFESPAVLTTNKNSLQQSAVNLANNLYDYDANTGELRFITELCSGPGLSGTNKVGNQPAFGHPVNKEYAVPDAACPATLDPYVKTITPSDENDDLLWLQGSEGGQSRFTPNGRYFFFTSVGQLTPDDTDAVADLYRYDFATGNLIRVSIGRRGNDGNGNDDAFPVIFGYEGGNPTTTSGSELAEDNARAVSEDGGDVIFSTKAALVSHDTNNAFDLYEWEEDGHGTCEEMGGCVSLISDGLDPHDVVGGVISTSGRDIAFHTMRGESPDDVDGVGDIYDARVNGGFQAVHPSAPCGAPESCRSGEPGEPITPTAGSETFVGPGNSATHLKCAKGKVRIVKHGQPRCVTKHRKKHRQKRHSGVHHHGSSQ